ncbi:hypothetical protein L0F63_005328 [Massospora cicadina]|nr:hypothetical protein L0F63_005328 [Massospora cicadina]
MVRMPYLRISLQWIQSDHRALDHFSAQGGRMNSKKRLKTVRTAERLVEYQEAEAQRKRIQKEELDKRIAKKLKVPVKRKILFDDNEYLEQSEQLKLGMRSAVSLTVSSQPESLFKASNKRTASVFDDEVSSTEESNSDEASSLSESSEDASEFGEVSANESCKVGQFKKRKVLALKKGPN